MITNCSCHIMAPCVVCINSFECLICGEIKSDEEIGEDGGEDIICIHCHMGTDSKPKLGSHICEFIDPGFGDKLWCKHNNCKNEKDRYGN